MTASMGLVTKTYRKSSEIALGSDASRMVLSAELLRLSNEPIKAKSHVDSASEGQEAFRAKAFRGLRGCAWSWIQVGLCEFSIPWSSL